MSDMLIVYYSWSNGNTKRIAEKLQRATGADIMEIQTVERYSGSYEDVVEQGKREVESGYTPAIQALPHDISAYQYIAVGTPTWWYTMAPAVLTFLSGQNWQGKTLIPFMTNGGWPGHVIADMKEVCKGASAACEMQIQFDSSGGDHMETPEETVDLWIENVNRLRKER